jgi:glucan phosphoethanolaminetransferase (alkaline phosphatase superfamily)
MEDHKVNLKARSLLRVTMWFALATGFLEVALRLAQRHLLDTRTFLSEDVVWMAPLANLGLFALVGGLLALGRRFRPEWVSLPRVAGLFLFLLLLGPALAVERLHPAATTLLAAGIAVQASRLLRTREHLFMRLIPATGIGMLVVLILLGAASLAGRRIAEGTAISALPDAPQGAPNVLLLILDTVRADDMGFHGYPLPTTPNLDKLAGQGVVFERAYATAPWTLPTHATLFTGRYPFEMSADWLTPLDDQHPTLAELLADKGYVTGGFVANLLYTTSETGLDRGCRSG